MRMKCRYCNNLHVSGAFNCSQILFFLRMQNKLGKQKGTRLITLSSHVLFLTDFLTGPALPEIFFSCSLAELLSSVFRKFNGNIALWEGNSEMKSRVWAQPAYLPYLLTKASATHLQLLGVKRVPASSGMRYLVAIFHIDKGKKKRKRKTRSVL